ncbi:hypothetical protein FSP39_016662 [Pinctada imbricata]|uniref:Major facilitator superfamily (MFS) profile domain-containing protein n=1 Tax=Pinctada imbricata TaxID=66713 RepID=A0AA89BMF9_PINIB|nr:hypothetical protein FSP39_016662 [Pinctada imbricata]
MTFCIEIVLVHISSYEYLVFICTQEDTEDVIITSGPVAPDGGYGWLVVFSSMMVHFIIGGFERSAGVIYLIFIERFGQSAAATAWVTSLPSSLRLIFGPVVSMTSNRFSCRSVVIGGSIVFTITTVISAFAPNLEFLFLVFGAIGGIARSFCYAPAVMMVGLYFNKRRGLAVGLSTCGVGFGSFAIPPLVELAYSNYGFHGAMILLAGLILNLSVCGFLFRPLSLHQRLMKHDERKRQMQSETVNGLVHNSAVEKVALASNDSLNMEIKVTLKRDSDDRKEEDVSDKQIKYNGENHDSEQTRNQDIEEKDRNLLSRLFSCNNKKGPDKPKTKFIEISLLRDFRFLSFCVAILFFTLAFQSAFVFLPAYGKQIGMDDMKSAYLVVIAGFCDGFARIWSGFILDLKRVKKYRVIIYNIVMFLVGAVSFIIPLTDTYLSLCIVCGVYGLLIGTYISQKSVIIVDLLGPEKLINSFGILICFQGIGMLIGPPISGMLKDINGKYDYAFIVGGTAMMVGAIILTISNVRHAILNKKK